MGVLHGAGEDGKYAGGGEGGGEEEGGQVLDEGDAGVVEEGELGV